VGHRLGDEGVGSEAIAAPDVLVVFGGGEDDDGDGSVQEVGIAGRSLTVPGRASATFLRRFPLKP